MVKAGRHGLTGSLCIAPAQHIATSSNLHTGVFSARKPQVRSTNHLTFSLVVAACIKERGALPELRYRETE